MKHLTTSRLMIYKLCGGLILASLFVGCSDSPNPQVNQQSSLSENQDADLWQATAQGNVDAIKKIVFAGKNINTPVPPGRDLAGATPIQVAIHANHLHVVDFMIRSGAHVHKPSEDKEGGEALHWAVRSKHIEIIKLLIKAGAKPDREDKHGRTAVDLANQIHADNTELLAEILDALKSNSH